MITSATTSTTGPHRFSIHDQSVTTTTTSDVHTSSASSSKEKTTSISPLFSPATLSQSLDSTVTDLTSPIAPLTTPTQPPATQQSLDDKACRIPDTRHDDMPQDTRDGEISGSTGQPSALDDEEWGEINDGQHDDLWNDGEQPDSTRLSGDSDPWGQINAPDGDRPSEDTSTNPPFSQASFSQSLGSTVTALTRPTSELTTPSSTHSTQNLSKFDSFTSKLKNFNFGKKNPTGQSLVDSKTFYSSRTLPKTLVALPSSKKASTGSALKSATTAKTWTREDKLFVEEYWNFNSFLIKNFGRNMFNISQEEIRDKSELLGTYFNRRLIDLGCHQKENRKSRSCLINAIMKNLNDTHNDPIKLIFSDEIFKMHGRLTTPSSTTSSSTTFTSTTKPSTMVSSTTTPSTTTYSTTTNPRLPTEPRPRLQRSRAPQSLGPSVSSTTTPLTTTYSTTTNSAMDLRALADL